MIEARQTSVLPNAKAGVENQSGTKGNVAEGIQLPNVFPGAAKNIRRTVAQ